MSMHVVDKATIDALVNAARQFNLITTTIEAELLGQLLWDFNQYACAYTHKTNTPYKGYSLEIATAEFDPLAIMRLVGYFNYQCCDYPAYASTMAGTWAARIYVAAYGTLPTYDREYIKDANGSHQRFTRYPAWQNAPWGISRLADMPT